MATLADLKLNLQIASKRACLKGASKAQINYIVSLVEKSGEEPALYFNNILSKGQASGVIDRLINPINYSPTSPEEIAAQREIAAAELDAANQKYMDHEEKKMRWISEHYPDYDCRSKKSRKRIRHLANKAMKG